MKSFHPEAKKSCDEIHEHLCRFSDDEDEDEKCSYNDQEEDDSEDIDDGEGENI